MVAKLCMLNPVDVQQCLQIMEHTAWQCIKHPPPWIVALATRVLRKLPLYGLRTLPTKLQSNAQVRKQQQQQSAALVPCRGMLTG